MIVVGWEATEMLRWDPNLGFWDFFNPIPLAYLDAPENSNWFIVGIFSADIETGGIVDCAVADTMSDWDWMPNHGHFTWRVVQHITISVNSSSGSPGTRVKISGSEATVNGIVSIYWDDMFMGNVTANEVGNFEYELTVPINASVGVHNITAVDTTTGKTASAPFKVILITLNPAIGFVGAKVVLNGFGFTPKTEARITFNDMFIGYALVSDSGNFTFTFNVPISTKGTQLIKAYDIGGYASKAFTVIDVTQLDV